MTSPSMESDFIDPATIDWTKKSDSGVAQAAEDGIPQAQAEAARRNREHPPPMDEDQD